MSEITMKYLKNHVLKLGTGGCTSPLSTPIWWLQFDLLSYSTYPTA